MVHRRSPRTSGWACDVDDPGAPFCAERGVGGVDGHAGARAILCHRKPQARNIHAALPLGRRSVLPDGIPDIAASRAVPIRDRDPAVVAAGRVIARRREVEAESAARRGDAGVVRSQNGAAAVRGVLCHAHGLIRDRDSGAARLCGRIRGGIVGDRSLARAVRGLQRYPVRAARRRPIAAVRRRHTDAAAPAPRDDRNGSGRHGHAARHPALLNHEVRRADGDRARTW